MWYQPDFVRSLLLDEEPIWQNRILGESHNRVLAMNLPGGSDSPFHAGEGIHAQPFDHLRIFDTSDEYAAGIIEPAKRKRRKNRQGRMVRKAKPVIVDKFLVVGVFAGILFKNCIGVTAIWQNLIE